MPVAPNGLLAEDQRGDQGDRVGLEQVRGHAGAVTHVVADVVGDGGGVARVVLGDARLDLADQVGADVGRLGEDAAADAHEHGQQRAAEAEALQDHRRGLLEDQQRQRGAEQAQADGDHPADATGAVGDPERGQVAAAAGGRGHPDVAAGGQRHPDEADQRGEAGAQQEEQRPPDARAPPAVGDRQREQEQEDDDGEDARASGTAAAGRPRLLPGPRARCPAWSSSPGPRPAPCGPGRRRRPGRRDRRRGRSPRGRRPRWTMRCRACGSSHCQRPPQDTGVPGRRKARPTSARGGRPDAA